MKPTRGLSVLMFILPEYESARRSVGRSGRFYRVTAPRPRTCISLLAPAASSNACAHARHNASAAASTRLARSPLRCARGAHRRGLAPLVDRGGLGLRHACAPALVPGEHDAATSDHDD